MLSDVELYTEPRARRVIRRRLLGWYDRSGRDLPWRRTRDPYAILVSEVMLQQTQVARVLPAYHRFLGRFPTLRLLASARLADVLREWQGLGYNRRARDLHRIARAAPAGLPHDVAALDALPGIGAYTAGAVACFSGGASVPFADTNIRRVLGRLVLGRVATQREAIAIDAELMPRAAARWHHALMDVGATLCRARVAECAACPLAPACRSRGRATPQPQRREIAFAQSTRRLRGLVLRELTRAGWSSRARLLRLIDDARAPDVLAGLARDGLIESASGRVRLPV